MMVEVDMERVGEMSLAYVSTCLLWASRHATCRTNAVIVHPKVKAGCTCVPGEAFILLA